MQVVQAPVAGLISASTAVIGALASGKGEALFTIIARSEFDLVGLVPTRSIAQARGRPDRRGSGSSAPARSTARMRRIAPTVEPNSQLGQVFIG